MARILAVDDDVQIVKVIERSLSRRGHSVVPARSGREAIALLRTQRPDLVILDIVMPDLTGIDVCRHMRTCPTLAQVPILFLTMRSQIEDKIVGFEAGCDDYLTKPFDLTELALRVQALLRYTLRAPTEGLLAIGDISADPDTGLARVGDRKVELTPVEFELLYYLISHAGEVISTEKLLQQVWGYPPGTGSSSLVRMHVLNLRRKIERDPQRPAYLRTVPRHGYMVQAER